MGINPKKNLYMIVAT